MRQEFDQELTPEIRLKMKKNLVYIGIFSVVMLFAGFTSAYLVMMGDSFWVKAPLPKGFWMSTAIILLSSLSFILAIRKIRKGDQKGLRLFMSLTLILGIAFIFFQFKGYGELIDRGIRPVNNHVIVTDGKYGEYYEIKYKDAFIEVDGNKFKWKGKDLTSNEMKDLQKFASQFLTLHEDKPFKVNNYAKPFILYFQNTPVSFLNDRLIKEDGEVLNYTDRLRLHQLALNIRDSRGDFFVRGELGKDFNIYYKGKALEYKDRTLMWQGKKLDNYLQLKATETADTASSFLFIITILHLGHVLVALIYLLTVTIRSFSGAFTADEHTGLITGSIFWHFLGLLWLYLLFFLLFIH
jgi:cytochrome c oxidase subunit III